MGAFRKGKENQRKRGCFVFALSNIQSLGNEILCKDEIFCVKFAKDSFPQMPNENASLGTAAKANPFGYPASL